MYTVYYPKSITRRLPDSVPGRGQLVHDDRDNSLAIGDGRTKFSELQKFSSGGGGGGLGLPASRSEATFSFFTSDVVSAYATYGDGWSNSTEQDFTEGYVNDFPGLANVGGIRVLKTGLYEVKRMVQIALPENREGVSIASNILLVDDDDQIITTASQNSGGLTANEIEPGSFSYLSFPAHTFPIKAGESLLVYDSFNATAGATSMSTIVNVFPLLQET